MSDSQRCEQIFLAIIVDVLTGLFLENVGEKFRSAAIVVPNLAGFGCHRFVDYVLHPSRQWLPSCSCRFADRWLEIPHHSNLDLPPLLANRAKSSGACGRPRFSLWRGQSIS